MKNSIQAPIYLSNSIDDHCEYPKTKIKRLEAENLKFKEQLEEAVKVIEFYSQASTWGVARNESVAIGPCDWETYPFSDNFISNEFRGGKMARQFLAKIKKGGGIDD